MGDKEPPPLSQKPGKPLIRWYQGEGVFTKTSKEPAPKNQNRVVIKEDDQQEDYVEEDKESAEDENNALIAYVPVLINDHQKLVNFVYNWTAKADEEDTLVVLVDLFTVARVEDTNLSVKNCIFGVYFECNENNANLATVRQLGDSKYDLNRFMKKNRYKPQLKSNNDEVEYQVDKEATPFCPILFFQKFNDSKNELYRKIEMSGSSDRMSGGGKNMWKPVDSDQLGIDLISKGSFTVTTVLVWLTKWVLDEENEKMIRECELDAYVRGEVKKEK